MSTPFERLQQDWENRTLNAHLDEDQRPVDRDDEIEWDCAHQGHEYEACGEPRRRMGLTVTPVKCIHCGFRNLDADED